jgi:tetratricopeptide (TPR) repeat protein
VRMILLSLMLAIFSSCKTTKKEDNYSIRFSDPYKVSENTILDSRLKELEKLADEYPKRSDIPYQIAGVWYQKENYRESARSLERAIYIDPQEGKYHFHLGRVYMNMRELDLAEKEFRRALELMPGDRYTGPHGAMGYLLCQKGRWQEAQKEFEACVRIDPAEPNSYYYLGCIADVQHNGDAAVANLKKYLELGGKGFRPKTVEILASYGVGARAEETSIVESGSDAQAGASPPKPASPPRTSDLDGLPGIIPEGPPAPPARRPESAPK